MKFFFIIAAVLGVSGVSARAPEMEIFRRPLEPMVVEAKAYTKELPKPLKPAQKRNVPKKVTPRAPAPTTNPTGNAAIGQQMAAARGWTGEQWNCLNSLWTKESGWNHLVENYEGSGAYGIPQALPGSKMATHGADWATNPRTQIAWGLDYIAGRYSTPCVAWNHSQLNNWY